MAIFKDPIKNIIQFLISSNAAQTVDSVVKFQIETLRDETLVASSSPAEYRVFHNGIRQWNIKDDDCQAVTISKMRLGQGKSPMDQTVEMALQVICWGNKSKEDSLMGMWNKVDNLFHNKHDEKYGATYATGMSVVHSFREQEPVFDTRFAMNASPATTRLSSRTKLRLPSVSALYTMLIVEQTDPA
jgi:hypothetical protein